MHLIGLCLCASAGRQAAPLVTLRDTASVSKLLREISAQTSTYLRADGRSGREILILDVKGADLSDLEARIAWATYSRWEATPSGPRLVEDLAASRAAERHYVRWQAAESALAIERYRTKILKDHIAPPRTRWENVPPTVQPLDRAMCAALADVKPEQTIYTSEFLPTFADNPSPAQLPFSDNGKTILATYNSGIKNPAVEREAAHAVLTCLYQYETVSAVLNLYDAEGQLVNMTRAYFPLYSDRFPRPLELADRLPGDVRAPVGEASMFFTKRIDTASATGFPIQFRPNRRGLSPDDASADAIVDRVRNPERFDPLGAFVADVWCAVAESQRKQLVANVDDVYLDPSWAINPPKLREAFKMAGGYNAEIHEDWLVARPSLPSPPWHHRIDRDALGKLLRSEPSDEFQSFSTLAEFAGDGPSTPDSWVMHELCAWADRPAPDIWKGWDEARIYGCLTPEQREALGNGRPIPLNELPDGSRRALIVLATKNDRGYYNLSEQPTVRWGSGFPANANLRVEDSSQLYFTVEVKDGGNTYRRYVGSVRQLAAWLAYSAKINADLLPQVRIEEHTQFKKALLADLLDPNGPITLFSVESQVGGRTYTWGEAPPEIREQVLAAQGKG